MKTNNSKEVISIESVKEKLFNLIEVNLAIDCSKITEETRIDEILNKDITTDYVEFIMTIESSFEIEIDNENIQEVVTIKDLISLIYNILKIKESNSKEKYNYIPICTEAAP